MDYADSSEVARFRAELRAWLGEHLPAHPGPFGFESEASLLRTLAWHRALAAAGYVGMSLREVDGGRGLPDTFEAVLNEELAAADAPPPPPIGHIAHAIADFAADALKARLLPRLLDCTEVWCQGFSEPGAGSDLAAISTTARRTDEGWVVNGHKIWTSGAMWADWCLLLARTEPDQPRHRGLSMLAVPMDAPGVDRREIVMATGSREFAEVFFDDVVVAADQLVGERGAGWTVAMHMLTYERGPADMGWVGRLGNVLNHAVAAIRRGEASEDPHLRRRLAAAAVDLRVMQWHVTRSLAERDPSGSSSSVDKLLTIRVEQQLHHVVDDLAGPRTVVGDEALFDDYLYSRAQSIYGGTQQIQRQIVAQRVLGLPRG